MQRCPQQDGAMGSSDLTTMLTSTQSFVQSADGSIQSISKPLDPLRSANTLPPPEEIIMSTSSGSKLPTLQDLALSFAQNSDLDSEQDGSSASIIPMRIYTRSEDVWSRLAKFGLFSYYYYKNQYELC